MQLLQANIGGFQGRASTLIGSLSDDGIIYLRKSDKAVLQRFKDAAIITNIPMNEYEYFFDESCFKEAINAYQFFSAKNGIVYSQGMERVRPAIQLEKVSESGVTYSLFNEIQNEQLSTIAICYLAYQLCKFETVCDFQAEIISIL